MRRLLAAAALLLAAPGGAGAEEARIAVATNFGEPAEALAADFNAATGDSILISQGSTGALYLQIRSGAPFAALLAADQARPERLAAEGLAVPESRFTYARGRLALFSRDYGVSVGPDLLRAGDIARIAIADPDVAPYGVAAMATLRSLGVEDAVRSRIVFGKNVAQAYQFVWSGSAEVGFVALAQVVNHLGGARWVVPESMHPPIDQDAILIDPELKAARAFLDYLKQPAAQDTIRSFGYGIVE